MEPPPDWFNFRYFLIKVIKLAIIRKFFTYPNDKIKMNRIRFALEMSA
uniref:Uncharacterized protein n=1 Tax=Tetranychus urticae TaxID=32264 RepID=T1KYA8_TETUR